MTPTEISTKFEALRIELRGLPEVGMSNYSTVLADYRQILNDVIVLGRELAQLWEAREKALASAIAIEKDAQTK